MRLAVFFALTVAAQATIYTFNNSATPPFYWSNSASWIPVGVPGAADTAILNNIKNVELPVNADVSVMNITLIKAELKIFVTKNNPVITIGDILAVSGSRLDVSSLPTDLPKFTIARTLTVSDSTILVSNMNSGDFSGSVLAVNGSSSISLKSNGFINGFKGPIIFPPTATLTCSEMPQGLTWNGQMTGSFAHCSLINSAVTAVGALQFTSVVLNNTQINAAGFKVTVLPPVEETKETHLTDGSLITADELVFSYPYSATTPSLDTYINCDAACKASVSVQNMTLDGYANPGYNVKIAVCLTVANTVRISDNLYNNLTAAAKPYIHFVQGATIANVKPLQAGDPRSLTILVGGEFRKVSNMCQSGTGTFAMKDQSGNLDLQLQENAVLDNVDLKGTLTISNTIAKTPANVVVKNGGGVQVLKIGHGTLTIDATTANYQISDKLQIEHPADYQMKQSILSIATITSGNPNLVLDPSNGIFLSAPLSMNRSAQSQMKVVMDVPVKTIDGDPISLFVQNSQMKVDITFSQSAPMIEIKALKLPGSANNTVDFSLTAGTTTLDASNLKLTSDGFTSNSTFNLNLGNASTYVPTEWTMPSLIMNGLLMVKGDRSSTWMAELVTGNAVGNQMPELTTDAALALVQNVTINAPSANWIAKSYIRLNGKVQGGGVLTVSGGSSLHHVYLLTGPLQNIILTGVNFTQYGNPSPVSGSVQFLHSTYVNDTTFGDDDLTTSYVLNGGASWEITNVTHPSDFTVSIPDPGYCLNGKVGETAQSCVAKATVPKTVTSAMINCIAPNAPAPSGEKPKGSEIAGIVIGVLIAVGILVGVGVFYMKRKGRHGYKDVEDQKL